MALDVGFSGRGWSQYQEWQDGDRKTLGRLNKLINETAHTIRRNRKARAVTA